MNQAARPTEDEIEAAARVLYEAGCFHHWWPKTSRSYEEFAATDSVAASEFGGIVARMLVAAARAKRNG